MWILIVLSVLSTNPLQVTYEPVVQVETVQQCRQIADTIVRHNPDARVMCIKNVDIAN
jgi:hypothetical protein